MKQKIKFIVEAVRWWDGSNTYHACRITRTRDGKVIKCKLQYGYGDQYRQTALNAMIEAKWLPAKYRKEPYLYERENNYPINWIVSDGLKRDAIVLAS